MMILLIILKYALFSLYSHLKSVCLVKLGSEFNQKILMNLISMNYVKFHQKNNEIGYSFFLRSCKNFKSWVDNAFFTIPEVGLIIIMILREFLKYFDIKERILFFTYLISAFFIYYLCSATLYKLTNISTISYLKSLNKISDLIINYDIIKSFNKEEAENESFKVINNDFIEKYSYESGVISVFYVLLQTLISCPYFAIIYIFIEEQIDLKMNIPEFIAFISLFLKLKASLNKITYSFVLYVKRKNGLKELFKIEESPELSSVIKKIQFNDSIEMVDVNLIAGNQTVQENVNLSFKKGEIIAITGLNGCGKSTLLKTFLRFFRYKGSIMIDGKDISLENERTIRNIMSYVPQTSYMINETVLYNLGYGQDIFNEEEIYRECKLYGFHDTFINLKNGYQTLMGQNGENLSGGEKQKISFMRAIIKNSPIVVKDEATSNMDDDCEKNAIESILKLSEDKTLFVIVHNLELLKRFKRIIFFDKNKVQDFQSYDEFMNKVQIK